MRGVVLSCCEKVIVDLAALSSPLVTADPLEGLHHHDGVTTDGLCRQSLAKKTRQHLPF